MEFIYINKCNLEPLEIQQISELEQLVKEEHTEVKLELEYKQMCYDAKHSLSTDGTTSCINSESAEQEYLCYLGEQLVGYLGVCDFDGSTIEVNGLVDPKFRRLGIYKNLMKRFLNSIKNRSAKQVLLLSDASSSAGVALINNYTKSLHHTEFEMYLDPDKSVEQTNDQVELRLATNKDSYEIDLQNSLYFHPENDDITLNEINPEDEIAKGFYVYLAIVKGQVIGKVNIQYSDKVSGIYGLGVKPEFRSQGYGRAILVRAIELIKNKHNGDVMLQVEVENDKALNLYKSCGFYVTYAMNYYELAIKPYK